MTAYKLHEDLSFCRVGSHFIFLDIGNDRYFRLSPALERSFEACLRNESPPKPDVDKLIECSIIEEHDAAEPSVRGSIAHEKPICSLTERPPSPSSPSVAEISEVFSIVLRTHIWLRTRSLKVVLDRMIADNSNTSCDKHSQLFPSTNAHTLAAASTFQRVRPYVPIEARCLLDSLALLGFLRRRGLRASLVLGVATDPFSAHCWVQQGDMVLNDSVGNAEAHTPILVR